MSDDWEDDNPLFPALEGSWVRKERLDALIAERNKALDELQLRKYKFVELSSSYDELLAERDAMAKKLEAAKEALVKVRAKFLEPNNNSGYDIFRDVDKALAEIAKLGEKK